MTMTKAERAAIVDEFKSRHGGHYVAEVFFEEVKAAGPSHPAYGWFEWDAGVAAYQYNIIQARMFAQNITILVQQPTIVENVTMNISTEAPRYISPLSTRYDGGGYVEMNVEDLSEEAAATLRSWLRRYNVCLIPAGLDSATFETAIAALEQVAASKAA